MTGSIDDCHPDEYAEFLAAIWGDGPHSVCWMHATFGFGYDFCDSPKELLGRVAADMEDCDVWFGAHPLRQLPEQGRGDRDDISQVVAIPADLDWAHWSRHTKEVLPTEAEVRDGIRRLGPDLQPTVVVHSGHGLQAWWVLTDPVGLDDAEQLIGQLDAALAAAGLVNGRPDLASLVRLPGTFNQKEVAG